MVRNARSSSTWSCKSSVDLFRRGGRRLPTLLTRGSVVGRGWGISASVSPCDSCAEDDPAFDPVSDSKSDSLSTCERWTGRSIGDWPVTIIMLTPSGVFFGSSSADMAGD